MLSFYCHSPGKDGDAVECKIDGVSSSNTFVNEKKH
jgi:hypothetical protein